MMTFSFCELPQITWVVILASFLLGLFAEMACSRLLLIFRGAFAPMFVVIATYGGSGIGLIFLSEICKGDARPIGLTWMVGIGLIRWLRKEI